MFMSEHHGAPVMLFALLPGMALNFLTQEEGGQKNRSAIGIDFTAEQVLASGEALGGPRPPLLPWFALAFAVLVAINSTGWLPTVAWSRSASRHRNGARSAPWPR